MTTTRRKEVNSMQTHIVVALAFARDFQAREIERAASERAYSNDRSSIRRSLGRRVIAVGQRIAAEPSLELARSR
jgi:hypothetical protein